MPHLTTHSTGLAISRSFILNLNCSPVNSGVRPLLLLTTGYFGNSIGGIKLNSIFFRLAISSVAIFGFACSNSKSTPTITAGDLNYRLAQEKVLIIDTRDANLFDAQHINAGGSVSIVDMEDWLKDESKGELIAISGAGPSDPSSERLAKTLKERGYTRVFILEGGFPAWVAGGLSTRSMVDIPMMARPRHARTEAGSTP